jgi:radical SAM protein with 4Fe4S-binding SPASM domain
MFNKDTLNIIRVLTVRRLMNLIQLRVSYIFAKYTKLPFVWGSPYAISIEPTTACNLACPECPSGLKKFTRDTGKLELDMNERILKSVGRQLFYINYYFQGEPFLHPQFLAIVAAAHERKIYTATSTNAHFITKEKAIEIVDSGLNRLIISIDGLTQATYENYRIHGKLDKVITGTKNIVAAKNIRKSSTPHLIFQFLVTQQNEHQIKELYNLAKELNVDEVRLKTVQVYDYENGNELLPKNEKYSRYKQGKNGRYRIKTKTGNHCWRMWSSTVFTWNGILVPCCFDKDAQYQLGNLQHNTFRSIWKNPLYTGMRKRILQERHQIDICTNCSEGAKVWV